MGYFVEVMGYLMDLKWFLWCFHERFDGIIR